MTKIRIMSDIHLEFGFMDIHYCGEDILVLAGDTGVGLDGLIWILPYAQEYNLPVVMIAGNHEFYKHEFFKLKSELRNYNTSSHQIHLLDNSFAYICGINFIGSTLWTDFTSPDGLGMIRAKEYLNDYRYILDYHGKPITPHAIREEHYRSREFLRNILLNPPVLYPKIVVVTHHLPSYRSVHVKYADYPINCAFASHMDGLVEQSGAKLWIHGHTHESADYMIGDTRVICNPRGYFPRALNPNFDPNLVIDV